MSLSPCKHVVLKCCEKCSESKTLGVHSDCPHDRAECKLCHKRYKLKSNTSKKVKKVAVKGKGEQDQSSQVMVLPTKLLLPTLESSLFESTSQWYQVNCGKSLKMSKQAMAYLVLLYDAFVFDIAELSLQNAIHHHEKEKLKQKQQLLNDVSTDVYFPLFRRHPYPKWNWPVPKELGSLTTTQKRSNIYDAMLMMALEKKDRKRSTISSEKREGNVIGYDESEEKEEEAEEEAIQLESPLFEFTRTLTPRRVEHLMEKQQYKDATKAFIDTLQDDVFVQNSDISERPQMVKEILVEIYRNFRCIPRKLYLKIAQHDACPTPDYFKAFPMALWSAGDFLTEGQKKKILLKAPPSTSFPKGEELKTYVAVNKDLIWKTMSKKSKTEFKNYSQSRELQKCYKYYSELRTKAIQKEFVQRATKIIQKWKTENGGKSKSPLLLSFEQLKTLLGPMVKILVKLRTTRDAYDDSDDDTKQMILGSSLLIMTDKLHKLCPELTKDMVGKFNKWVVSKILV